MSYKMKKGADYHDSKIRKKTQTKLEKSTIYYNRFIVEPDLGLAALFDAYVESENDYYPIEFKTGKIYATIPQHHLIQLVIQAIILENVFQTDVNKAEIRYGADKRIEIPITLQDKIHALEQHTIMLQIVTQEIIPPPTPHEKKCQDCEFWLQCWRA